MTSFLIDVAADDTFSHRVRINASLLITFIIVSQLLMMSWHHYICPHFKMKRRKGTFRQKIHLRNLHVLLSCNKPVQGFVVELFTSLELEMSRSVFVQGSYIIFIFVVFLNESHVWKIGYYYRAWIQCFIVRVTARCVTRCSNFTDSLG